jgi:hypothetical protein
MYHPAPVITQQCRIWFTVTVGTAYGNKWAVIIFKKMITISSCLETEALVKCDGWCPLRIDM